MPNDIKMPFWEHYCDRQHDIVGFPKGIDCDWCGKSEEEIMGEGTISVDSFNNKGQKGDDDFETWMREEAPFVTEDSTMGTLGEGYGSYTVDLSQHATCTSTMNSSTITGINPTFTIKGINFAKSIQKRLPIDILHKWYPEQMKEADD